MADQLAAVVMAGGIGTRMKSATPKHLHPLLGRRMVDWVVDAAREAGVERLVVVASPQTSDLLEDVEVAVQEEPLGTGDAVRCARAALDGLRRRRPRPQRRRPCAQAGDDPRRSSRRTAPPAPRRPSSPSSPSTPARTGGSSATATAGWPRSWRPRDASPEELALRRGQLRHLRLPRREALAGARAAGRAQRPGRALRHRHARPARRPTASPAPCCLRTIRSRPRA